MTVTVPAFLSVRRARFLVVSTADSMVRRGCATRDEAERHAAKPLTRALAGGSPLVVVEKASCTLRGVQ